MENLMQHHRVVFGVLGFLFGFPIIAYGIFQGETLVFWAGIAMMVVGFLAARPPNPEDRIEERVEEFDR